MVEVRASRVAVEALAGGTDSAHVTRLDVQAGALPEGASEVQCSRVVAETLSADPALSCAATRLDVQAGALPEGASEVQCSRVVAEILSTPLEEASITRLDVQAGALPSQATEVRASRLSAEALARQGSGSTAVVSPLPLVDDVHIFLHNWATQAEMRSSFRNSVTYSPDSGAESRRGLTAKPFRTLQLEWLLADGEDVTRLERLEVFLRRLTDQRFQVPIYMDQQELSASYLSGEDTISIPTNTARLFPGQRVAVVQLTPDHKPSSFTFHIIESMTNNSLTFTSPLGVNVSAGSLVFPMMDCEVLLGVESNYLTSRVPSVSLSVAEAPGLSQLPALRSDIPSGAEEYDGYPVWYEEPDWINGIVKGRRRHGSKSDSGRADFVSLEADRSRQHHSYALSGSREDMWKALEFFDTRRGRLRAFWHIDQDQYMKAANIDATGNFVSVSEVGDIADFQEEFDFVGIVMKNGDLYVREAVTIQQILTVFRITMDVPIDTGLSVSDVVRVARARISRFDKDEFVEQWNITGHMQCSVAFIEVLNEEDFPTL